MEIKKLARTLFTQGYRYRASDLYLFPVKEGYEISYRLNQGKKTYGVISQEKGEQLLLYFKYMADMDVSEKRRIQVGAGSHAINGKQRRMRFSTVANYQNRESLVIRFLHDVNDKDAYNYFFESQYKELKKQVQQRGLYLFSGPTGSGKTTTMYRLAKEIQKKKKQIITIEDPVELEEASFLQLQTNPKIHLSYEELVKVCLRHRPDILIVGEIRDGETAQAVIRGALTGHTIFSTIHSMSVEGAIARLLELQVSEEELAQSLRGIIYQQLLPKKCGFCKGSCSIYCPNRKEAVLFDTYFTSGKGERFEERKNNWEKNIFKAWQYGFITSSTYHSEK